MKKILTTLFLTSLLCFSLQTQMASAKSDKKNSTKKHHTNKKSQKKRTVTKKTIEKEIVEQKAPIDTPVASKEDVAKVNEQQFIEGTNDIPLFRDLIKMSEEGLDFDSAAGSIISSKYQTNDDIEEVKSFYVTSLPELGWEITDVTQTKLSFQRDKQKLEIEFIKISSATTLDSTHDSTEGNFVEFFISPVAE